MSIIYPEQKTMKRLFFLGQKHSKYLLQKYNKNYVFWALLLEIMAYYRLMYFFGKPLRVQSGSSSSGMFMPITSFNSSPVYNKL